MHIQYVKMISALRVAVGTSDTGRQALDEGGVGRFCLTGKPAFGCFHVSVWRSTCEEEEESWGLPHQDLFQELRRHAAELFFFFFMNSVCYGL